MFYMWKRIQHNKEGKMQYVRVSKERVFLHIKVYYYNSKINMDKEKRRFTTEVQTLKSLYFSGVSLFSYNCTTCLC